MHSVVPFHVRPVLVLLTLSAILISISGSMLALTATRLSQLRTWLQACTCMRLSKAREVKIAFAASTPRLWAAFRLLDRFVHPTLAHSPREPP